MTWLGRTIVTSGEQSYFGWIVVTWGGQYLLGGDSSDLGETVVTWGGQSDLEWTVVTWGGQ